jgi:hypothetical protein
VGVNVRAHPQSRTLTTILKLPRRASQTAAFCGRSGRRLEDNPAARHTSARTVGMAGGGVAGRRRWRWVGGQAALAHPEPTGEQAP